MTARGWLLALGFVALLMLGGAVENVQARATHKRCPHGYVLHHVKRHHRRTAICVRVPKPHSKPTTVKAPVAPPARTTHLRAHLDPSFTQSPLNPGAVVYSYSAEATAASVALNGVPTTEPAPLPEGILSLYSDGSLVCSINVGGATTSGSCPVTYLSLGAHTVVTTYTSGSTSATETSVENVEPFATTTALSVTPEGCGEESEAVPSGSPPYVRLERSCVYGITAATRDQNGNVPPVPSGLASLDRLSVGADAPVTLTVAEDVAREDGTNELLVQECRLHWQEAGQPEGHRVTCNPQGVEVKGEYGDTESERGALGWRASQSAPVTLAF